MVLNHLREKTGARRGDDRPEAGRLIGRGGPVDFAHDQLERRSAARVVATTHSAAIRLQWAGRQRVAVAGSLADVSSVLVILRHELVSRALEVTHELTERAEAVARAGRFILDLRVRECDTLDRRRVIERRKREACALPRTALSRGVAGDTQHLLIERSYATRRWWLL